MTEPVKKDADTQDLLEFAWGIIANAGGGDWTKESEMWQEAAARWRAQYFATLPVAAAFEDAGQ